MVYLDNLLALYQGVRQIGAFGAAVWCNCAPLAPLGHAAPELYSALQKPPLGGARPPFVRCVLWGKPRRHTPKPNRVKPTWDTRPLFLKTKNNRNKKHKFTHLEINLMIFDW